MGLAGITNGKVPAQEVTVAAFIVTVAATEETHEPLMGKKHWLPKAADPLCILNAQAEVTVAYYL